MRPITIAACSRSGGSAKPTITLHALAAVALAALAASSAAAAPAQFSLVAASFKNAGGNYVHGQKQDLAVESFSFGETTKGAPGAAKYGAVGGMHRDDGVSAAAEKRQHGWNSVSKPLDRGSVRIKVKSPWLGCAVGASYPDAMLQTDAARYEFQDAIITGCAADSVSLNYTKVQVRGWDPEKKQQ